MSPALSDVPVRKVVRVLESVGFAYNRTRGSHAVYRHEDGRVAIVPMHGTVKRGTLASILRQAGLSPDEFLGLL
ncbi:MULTISPECIES: type II toxin-antitoxin system HicA family toxin [Actinosynnema]|uniref:type II toxin-antitoxin system HicA family toxin n=1 Tax=Actinosynnema TaxID=40566 RepID=UPI0020A464AD|nr:type II toxin-antitoxin system HicA family toxin [Actinosynnema pretiosum]MCP2093009.1 putative RNA binding protein YcfA, dsRBD-like fold, HicA-like mRNA interferase family [Actinosynnema pretiosum]